MWLFIVGLSHDGGIRFLLNYFSVGNIGENRMKEKCDVFRCCKPSNRTVTFNNDPAHDPLLVIQLCVDHTQKDYFDSIPQRERGDK